MNKESDINIFSLESEIDFVNKLWITQNGSDEFIAIKLLVSISKILLEILKVLKEKKNKTISINK